MKHAEDNDILARNGGRTGMTVPDGYFEDFAKSMEESLPHMPWEDEQTPTVSAQKSRSWWMRVRPYVYMAAMFAGIWCMMNIFDHVRPQAAKGLDFDSNPVLTAAVSNDRFMEEYFYDDLNDDDLMWLDYEGASDATTNTSHS